MRVAVVTGGGKGMGRSICLTQAQRGDAVAILDWDGEAAEQVAEEIRAAGGTAIAVKTDVSDRAQVDAAMKAARSDLGPIGILVTSAGIAPFQPFTDITQDDWDKVLAVNLTGTFHCVQSAIPDMLDSGWGRLVLISSSSAQRGSANMAHYAASKGGVFGLVKALAVEFAPRGITVNNIAPSSIDSPMSRQSRAAGSLSSIEEWAKRIPVGRLGTGDDIAAACAFLCSDEASYFTGQTMSVNGGSFIN